MAFGLEIRNGSGALTLSLTSRLLRHIGYASFSVGANSYVDISVPGCTPDGTWAAFCDSSDAVALVMVGYIRVRSANLLLSASGTVVVARC